MLKTSTFYRIRLAALALILFVFGASGVFASQERNVNRTNSKAVVKPKVTPAPLASKSSPFVEDFELGTFPPTSWAVYNLLDNSVNWEQSATQNHTPNGSSSAYHEYTTEASSVDNWLVTPQITVPANGFHYLSFWSFLGNGWSYKKNSVLISTGSPNPADGQFVEKWVGVSNDGWIWTHFFVNLQEYVGQDIYIAFRYEGDQYGHFWNIDDVSLVDDSPALGLSSLEVTSNLGLDGAGSKTLELANFGLTELTFDTEIEYADASGWLEVVPASGSVDSQMSTEVILNFDANGLAAGAYQANVNITTNDPANPTVTVQVTLNVVDVNVYPFTENFEGEDFPPIGWSTYNTDGDENDWTLSWFNNTPDGQYSAYHGFGWTPQDGWLVSPKITIPTEGYFYLTFWNYVGDALYYSKNSVHVSTNSGNPTDGDFVEVWTPESVTEGWVQQFINLQAYAGQDIYFAFRYEGEYAHYWVVDDIALGEEIDDSPVISISTPSINQVVGVEGAGTKSFKISNDGIQNLTFDIDIEFVDGDGWLTANPLSGSIPAKSSSTISVAFDAAGLELGTYSANINITSNDTENPTITVVVNLTVREAQVTNLEIIYPEYTFPTAISADGRYVSGSQFGGKISYQWAMFNGAVDFAGEALGITNTGLAVGTYDTEFTFDGIEVSTAGIWDRSKQQWQFLGMNPEVPEFFGSFYNSAYGITPDGTTVVGMQWYPDFSVKAIKWTQEDGYVTLSPDFTANTRANGISANGSVIYGWAEPNWTRTAAIWYNDEMILIDETQYGEAAGASASGNYVTGSIGSDGYLWSPTEGITLFQNTLNSGIISPIKVLDDGTVFGYTNESFPPLPPTRRAFVRHPDGSMETFNDYVQNRGWFDAADWIFFSVNDVTPDGNKFIGAAELPGGVWISFMLDLSPGSPTIEVNPLQLSQSLDWGGSSSTTVNIGNAGTGFLNYNALVLYTTGEPKVKSVPVGKETKLGNISLATTRVTAQPNAKAQHKGTTLNYDGDNVDAIGLTSGGTFFGASRFPSELTAVYEGYELQSVDVFVKDAPTSFKLIIWNAGTTTSPGEILHEQVFVPTDNSWNRIDLSAPLAITGTDIWVGVETTHSAGNFILGIDAGPAASDGNWISMNATEWERLSDYGLSRNWNIRANLTFNGMDWLSLSNITSVVEASNQEELGVHYNAEGLPSGTYYANIRITSNDSENSVVIIPVTLEVGPAPISTLTLIANPAEWGSVLGGGTFAAGTVVELSASPNSGYRVVNWTETELGIISTLPTFNYTIPATNITLYANFEVETSINENMLGSISVYPNPASHALNIESSQPIQHVKVLNMLGQQVLISSASGFTTQLDISTLSVGTYIVQVHTTVGLTVKRVQVKR